jgi:hypothetical protein
MKIASLSPIARPWMRLYVVVSLFLWGCGRPQTPLSNLWSSADEDVEISRLADVIGTQTIGAKYKFTDDSVLVESAKAILATGSRILKVNLGEVGSDDFEALLAMPFHTYLFWFHGTGIWTDGLTEKEKENVYRETYDLASRLKTRFHGKEKVFYLGHWEGDWQLLKGFDGNRDPEPIAIQGMIDWLNIRQKALNAVNQDFPASDVKIYHYTEVNRVFDAIEKGKSRVVNKVLPFTNVDFVSYSSYDAQQRPQADVNRALDYIEARLKPNPDIQGKRVIVTEFGLSADAFLYNQLDHDRVNRQIMVKYLEWGVPMILYWEMYNNEVVDGRHRGFWLIDHKNIKWPLYHTMLRAHTEGRRYIREYREREGQPPSRSDYLSWLKAFLNTHRRGF